MNPDIRELKLFANTLRQDIVEIAYRAQGPSHPGPALSCADIVAALYGAVMNIDPQDPRAVDRDRFILSKGHACPVLYSALAERGFFPKDWLWDIRRVDSKLQGHPDMTKTPGVDMTSGSLGNGLSIGVGMGLYLKLCKSPAQVFVILGDGEIQEGPVWESFMGAPALGADNVTAIIDLNHFQSCGAVYDIMPLGRIDEILEDMGWNVICINGHCMEEVLSALDRARCFRGKPTCIIADTVKGKGVSFMEYDNSWHQRIPSDEQYEKAINELKEERRCL